MPNLANHFSRLSPAVNGVGGDDVIAGSHNRTRRIAAMPGGRRPRDTVFRRRQSRGRPSCSDCRRGNNNSLPADRWRSDGVQVPENEDV